MFHHINNSNILIFDTLNAGVVKLVDTLDLGSSASRHGGSSPFTRTIALAYVRVFLKQSVIL